MQMEICSVKLSDGTTHIFCLESDISQGCPVFVYLFLVAAHMFCHYIKTSKLEGNSSTGRNIILSQLPDTALLLRNALFLKLQVFVNSFFQGLLPKRGAGGEHDEV